LLFADRRQLRSRRYAEPMTTVMPPGFDVEAMTEEQLIAGHKLLLDEMQLRGTIRTRSVVGELGERRALMAYGGALAPKGEPGFDLVDASNRSVQVKTRTLNRQSQVVTFDNLDFDVVVFVALAMDSHDVAWARETTAAEVAAIANPYRGKFRVALTKAARSGIDVTERFAETLSA
jgi:hypothetical protein